MQVGTLDWAVDQVCTRTAELRQGEVDRIVAAMAERDDSEQLAHLFAAAPELLAELKAARDIVAEAFEYSDYMAATLGRGHSFTDIYGRAELAILRGIEAAIAKAEGGGA